MEQPAWAAVVFDKTAEKDIFFPPFANTLQTAAGFFLQFAGKRPFFAFTFFRRTAGQVEKAGVRSPFFADQQNLSFPADNAVDAAVNAGDGKGVAFPFNGFRRQGAFVADPARQAGIGRVAERKPLPASVLGGKSDRAGEVFGKKSDAVKRFPRPGRKTLGSERAFDSYR